jgi:hypothetical protein
VAGAVLPIHTSPRSDNRRRSRRWSRCGGRAQHPEYSALADAATGVSRPGADHVDRALDQAFDRALAAAQEAGWRIVTADKGSGRIEATDTTRWFGFQDDIAVRLTPWGAGTRVDVRSVSRVGRSDAGTNARRIRRYLDRLR